MAASSLGRTTRAATIRLGRSEILLLGLLSAIGPIGIDIYLPAFAAIAADLQTDIGSIQLSMAVYFLALGLGQLPFGMASDRFGRKGPILLGLTLFIVGSMVCATAEQVSALLAGRFVQGLGICSILSIVRAVVRDLHGGKEAAHLAARILLVVSVSPMLAPLAGSVIISFGVWRAIFWLLAALAGCLLLASIRFLPETARSAGSPDKHVPIAQLRALIREREFLLPTLLLACAQAGASLYLAGSSAVYLLHYQATTFAYSLAFAANAGAMILAAQCNRYLIGRFGMAAVLVLGTGIGAFSIVLFIAAKLVGHAGFPLACVCFFLFFAAFGFVMGPASVLGMEKQKHAAGVAAGLQGTIQFAAGALAAGLLGLLEREGSLEPLLSLLGVGQLAAFSLALLCRKMGEGNVGSHGPALHYRRLCKNRKDSCK
ncbi:Bcr/CflA family drug resistance efflux transporter [Altererythrobacter sp. B11]|uniref:multidrug effflux MFS transporter n=1 Tax=Altererythrobacter sp. B11 TaxID=2060312 RepID=UPI000DC72020|nr:multidrug effflux MFS transporter [Altererythrobacter sp. B11]BBC73817.1 Bcr/CflA family drug resistance efflux transporter [Altererythrobacter sp. B11]